MRLAGNLAKLVDEHTFDDDCPSPTDVLLLQIYNWHYKLNFPYGGKSNIAAFQNTKPHRRRNLRTMNLLYSKTTFQLERYYKLKAIHSNPTTLTQCAFESVLYKASVTNICTIDTSAFTGFQWARHTLQCVTKLIEIDTGYKHTDKPLITSPTRTNPLYPLIAKQDIRHEDKLHMPEFVLIQSTDDINRAELVTSFTLFRTMNQLTMCTWALVLFDTHNVPFDCRNAVLDHLCADQYDCTYALKKWMHIPTELTCFRAHIKRSDHDNTNLPQPKYLLCYQRMNQKQLKSLILARKHKKSNKLIAHTKSQTN